MGLTYTHTSFTTFPAMCDKGSGCLGALGMEEGMSGSLDSTNTLAKHRLYLLPAHVNSIIIPLTRVVSLLHYNRGVSISFAA